MTAILGISAFYHDSAAALVVDGKIVAAAQEERFTRKKHDHDFPARAIDYCLKEGGFVPADVDYVGFYDKPLLKFERLIETYLAYAPRGFRSFAKAMPLWLKTKLHLPRIMDRGLRNAYRKRYVFPEHHESHAASAFYPSPFSEAAILTVDGVGEWATASWGTGRDNRINLVRELRFPHSPGLLYSAFTYFSGFKVNSDEFKLMGLAPYGRPKYADLILERIVDLKHDGSFRMDMSYFNYCQGLVMTSKRMERLFGGPPRRPDMPITEREMDLAASVQRVLEEIMLRMARHVHAETEMKRLCLAGGVALNCVANGRLLREGPFEEIWVQPAAGDAGGALGVALLIWHQLMGKPREPKAGDSQFGSLLGPQYSDHDIKEVIDSAGATHSRIDDDGALCEYVADRIAEGKVVGWFQGRMEFGPRALGSRSLLGDARNADMQSVMNLKIKFRESFRPFAPVVLREHASDYFDVSPDTESPYMLLVTSVRDDKRLTIDETQPQTRGIDKLKILRSEIPAVTHVDCSARLQTADAARNSLYHRLLETFHEKTGCPLLVNTSFNLGWDPIVRTPRDAYDTFMSSDIDVLCMGHYVLEKARQPAAIPAERSDSLDPLCGELLVSPCCEVKLSGGGEKLSCSKCNRTFALDDGIPLLFHPHEGCGDSHDVTEMVKAFYEKTPFPNYDEHDSLRSLIEKSRSGVYARMLNEAIGYNSTVLDVGCGTGQLVNFLGIACRRVIGTDICLNSLRMAEDFREQHNLSRVRFVQMNLFRPCLKPEAFDAVFCNGVLHHTGDPFGGLQSIIRLLKPGGYLVVGLYNRYGRIATDLRRAVFRATGGKGQWLDPYLRKTRMSSGKRRAWFADQYRHPHESKHTIGEVLRWFERCDLNFVRGVPSVVAGSGRLEEGSLFDPTPTGTVFDHLLAQTRHVFTGGREGGFFIMIGRKRPVPEAANRMDERS